MNAAKVSHTVAFAKARERPAEHGVGGPEAGFGEFCRRLWGSIRSVELRSKATGDAVIGKKFWIGSTRVANGRRLPFSDAWWTSYGKWLGHKRTLVRCSAGGGRREARGFFGGA
jgi:hypothetical protein